MRILLGIVRFVAAIVLAGAIAFAVWRFGPWGRTAAPIAAAPSDSTFAGMRAVSLYFASAGGDSLEAETREMLEQPTLHDRVTMLVQALDQGSRQGRLAVLPAGTSVLHVYMDERGTLTLDLSRAFQQGFRGGSRAEELAIGSLVRTLATNLPELKKLRLTCGGASIATLGGHLPLDEALDPHDWP
jgi:hypothetical protein